jgi:(R,R)-butanediol dehydrogenase/meso-butanediol dehydrogenase/diacetyl reductase
MAAAVYRGRGRIEVEELPVPEPGPGEVLLEVGWCGICGSDLHVLVEGMGHKGSVEGHEYSGTVSAIGDGVAGLSIGEQVVGRPALGCGECRQCRRGRPSLCDARDTPGTAPAQGAFATYKLLSAGDVQPLPQGLSTRAAALTEPLAVALHGITLSQIEPGQRALVMGCGPIGALTLAALRALGIDDVSVCEPAASRRALAERLGATAVVEPDDLDVPSMAEPGRVVDGAVDVVFECSGKAAAMEAGLAQLQRGGTMVFVGAGIHRPRLDPNRILLNEVVITGAFCYDADGFPRALELLASGRLPIDDLVEPDDVALHDLPDALARLAAGELAGKVMVRPGLTTTGEKQ